MPATPVISPATGRAISDSYIHTTDCSFVDNAGRTLLLRGVNLSGSSKFPIHRPSYLLDGFWETAENGGESFVGRPLNIDDGSADVHLARLRGWGFSLLRFPFTWEALEHAGPGKYDDEFMDYVVRVLRKCKQYGFKVFMDPHQDTWSRFSGGSGAPYWTLLACGINPRNFTATQAAIIHSEYPLAHDADPASLPAMIWGTNYGRLASQTLFTLFFAGRDFAPKCIIDGKNIQDYLEEHYIAAVGRLADRIRDAGDLLDECVIGWDSINEPFEGLCGWDDLQKLPTKQGSMLKKGTAPTPAQGLRLGMGQAQTVDHWTFGPFGATRDGTVTIDPKGIKVWSDPWTEIDGVHPKWGWKRDPGWELGTCVWAQHGVWDIESGYILRPDYFKWMLDEDTKERVTIDFIADYWRRHLYAYADRIRLSHPEAILFVHPPVFAPPPPLDEDVVRGRCAYSPHYYDGLTLVTRHWNWFNADALGLLRGKYASKMAAVKIGESAIRKSFQDQLAMFKDDALILGAYPTVLGEIGTPFDMDGKRSYGWTDGGKYKGDYGRQEKALDASLNGADGGNVMNWTAWTFCPDGTHEWGDGWNMEDLSLWCPDDVRRPEEEEREEEGGGLFAVNDASDARLLQKDGATLGNGVSAAASSLSLPTLGNGGGPEFQIPKPLSTSSSSMSLSSLADVLGCHQNPYEFLTDGARAVKAFCRPYPRKVVGKPKEIKFDIKKAELKVVVVVRPEDKPRRIIEDKEAEEPATEIFLPIIHFAHEKLITADLNSYPLRASKSECVTPSTSGTASVCLSQVASQNVSSTSVNTVQPAPIKGLVMGEPYSRGTSVTARSRAPSIRGGELGEVPRLVVPAESDYAVDVEVSVSAGRWKVEGQVLKWWYDVPTEGEREYVIEVRRRGGAIMKGAGGVWWPEWCCSVM